MTKGVFSNTGSLETVRFQEPVQGRVIRLKAFSEIRGQYYTTIAELGVIEAE